ncbi:MAG: DNA polymerase III subunit gamma/tau [Velocimicrobium sp.]
MSYTALYRKFRPREFEDVKGQDHIVTTLKNQIKADRIGHAYLFCGTRGTGKTTVAKILAKAVNCEHPVEGSPCNECAMCKAINAQNSMNVIEIDAASNNGVDNIREIVDEVQYSPTEGKYKVYIIDEVHMLSTGAFNALLKTLEEPPFYVIFILATTEAHKIPITIVSRCQKYDFKRITIDIIADRLNELLLKEGVEAEDKAVRYVAKAADGSMRDGLSLLDQCIAFYLGETLTYDKVLEVLGAVDIEVLSRMYRHIVRSEVVGAIELLEELVIAGRELTQFVIDFTWYLRNLLLIKTSDQALDMIDVSTEQQAVLKQEATLLDTDTIIRYIRVLSELSNQLKYASQKRVLIEVALIKLCKPAMETNLDSILDRIRQLEKQVAEGAVVKEALEVKEKPSIAENKKEQRPVIYPNAIPEDLKQAASNWQFIVARLSSAVRSMMTSMKPSIGEGNTLLLLFTDELEKTYVGTDEHIAEIEAAIKEKIHKEVVVRVQYINESHESVDNFVDLTKIINMKIEYED